MQENCLRKIQKTNLALIEIDSNELLRSIILNNLLQPNKKIKKTHYHPLKITVIHSNIKLCFNFDIYLLLQLYKDEEPSSNLTLEERTNLIMNLIYRISNVNNDLQLSEKILLDVKEVLKYLIKKEFKEQQEEKDRNLLTTLNIKKPKKNKIQRVSILEGETADNGQKLTRNTIKLLEEEEEKDRKNKINNKSELSKLINKCNIFEQPEKIEALKRRKFIECFCESAEEYDEIRQKYQEKKEYTENEQYNLECLQMMEEWVGELTLCEELIERKINSNKYNNENQDWI